VWEQGARCGPASDAGVCRSAASAQQWASRSSGPGHRSDVFGEVLGVATDADEQSGLERVHPVQAQEVEARRWGDPALLERSAFPCETPSPASSTAAIFRPESSRSRIAVRTGATRVLNQAGSFELHDERQKGRGFTASETVCDTDVTIARTGVASKSAGPAAGILTPSPDATDGALCATRREAWVTGLTAGPVLCWAVPRSGRARRLQARSPRSVHAELPASRA